MTRVARIAVVTYLLTLTMGMLAGQWPLQGPQLIGAGSHGVHVGDVMVLAATAIASVTVLKPTARWQLRTAARPHHRPRGN